MNEILTELWINCYYQGKFSVMFGKVWIVTPRKPAGLSDPNAASWLSVKNLLLILVFRIGDSPLMNSFVYLAERERINRNPENSSDWIIIFRFTFSESWIWFPWIWNNSHSSFSKVSTCCWHANKLSPTWNHHFVILIIYLWSACFGST